MFRFIHAADVHLDSPLRGLAQYEGAPVDEIRGAARRALEALVDLASDEQVALVLFAGDLYDGDWHDHNTGLFFANQMARLGRRGIRAFIVRGNHDAASRVTKRLSMPENVTVLDDKQPETVVLDELGVAIHGQSYRVPEVREDLSASYPEAKPGLLNIGLLHTMLGGQQGHEPYAPSTLEGLHGRGYDYWALGHVHQRRVISEHPWVVYPGNLQGRHARETGPKGCTLVTVEGGEVTAVEERVLDVVRWDRREVDAAGVGSANELLSRIGAQLGESLAEAGPRLLAVRLSVVGACPLHAEIVSAPERWRSEVERIANELGAGSLWLEKVRWDTRGAVRLEGALERDDALGGLLRTIRDLPADEARIAELRRLFDDLVAKLPQPLKRGAEAPGLTDATALGDAIEDARELLLARLAATGDEG